MKKRVLYIVLAAVFTATLVLTAAAAGPAPGDGLTEPETSAPAPDTTDEPSDGPADGPVEELPDGPDDGPGDEAPDEPGDKTPDEPGDGSVDDPADDPVDGPMEEPADEPSPAALDEPMAINEDSNVPYVDANGSEQTCSSATVVEEGAAAWDGGWYVAKDSVTISQFVEVSGEVNLILTDGCSLTVNGGIQVLEGNFLTIWGQEGGTGKLIADGRLPVENGKENEAGWRAGIGGNADKPSVGSITINGGDITAIGGSQNAGIGSAGTFEKITINGGTVEATGLVGIGTRVEHATGGPIVITGGTVTASSSIGSNELSIGIGGRVDSITIRGGTVNASSSRSAGIGSIGGGNITIEGGTVTATGGSTPHDSYGPGGVGISSTGGGDITIRGGTVTATGGDGYDPVGSGGAGISSTGSGDVTITGGTVNAAGGAGSGSNVGGAGIDSSGSGRITVSGGTVRAAGGSSDYYTNGGIEGSFSTGENGNALVYSSGIGDQSGKGSWSGVIFEGNAGQVYGSPTPAGSFAVENGQTLTVPVGSVLTVGEGVTLTNDGTIQNRGNIKRAGSGTITGSGRIYGDPVDGYGLEIAAPTFDEVKYGYGRPDAKAITIMNTGTAVEHISKVELTDGDKDAFELAGSFTDELTPKSFDGSWTIWPKAGLEADSYDATVSVTYDFGCTATAEVSFAVGQADGMGTVTMADYTCGDNSVEPEIHSTTNTAGTEGDDYIFYKVRGADDDTYTTDKPAAAGEYTVRVYFNDSENYSGFTAEADFTVRHQLNGGWKQQSDGGHRICVCGAELLLKADALTEVPDGLTDIYESAEKLTKVLAEQTDTGGNYAVYDVELSIKESGGDWHEAGPADIPAGGITVTLPYPEGTDAGYTFTAVHMFASGKRAGQTERPAVKNDAGGVTFTVTGLSPVCIGWKAPAAGATASPAATAPYTGDESPVLFWTAALCLAGAALGTLLFRRRRG